MEGALRGCLSGETLQLLEECESTLTSSKNHGCHHARGAEYETFLQARRFDDKKKMTTSPLAMQKHTRFGVFARNAQRVAVNIEEVGVFYKEFCKKVPITIRHIATYKTTMLCQLAAAALVYTHLVSSYWSKVSSPINKGRYEEIESLFEQTVGDLVKAASPSLAITADANKFKADTEMEEGFPEVVHSLARDEETSKALDECVVTHLTAALATFNRFKTENLGNLEGLVMFTNQVCIIIKFSYRNLFFRMPSVPSEQGRTRSYRSTM